MSNINSWAERRDPGSTLRLLCCQTRTQTVPFSRRKGKLPARPSNAHYHCRIRCIRAMEPAFVGKALVVPEDVKSCLEDVHLQHLYNEFGVILQM